MTLTWAAGRIDLAFSHTDADADAPVHLTRLAVDGAASVVATHPLVDLFTASEQRERTSQAFILSAVGSRLRHVDHRIDVDSLHIRQRDAITGLEVTSTARVRPGTAAAQWTHTVRNGGDRAVTLTAISSLELELADREGLRLLWGESEWLAESRWHEQPLTEALPALDLVSHGQDGRGRFVRASHGAWSTGEYLPTGLLVRDDGPSLAWQIETSAGWSWEIAQTQTSITLVAAGPSDLEHGFAERLKAGESFTSVPVGLAVADGGRDAAFAALTGYRRALHERRPVDASLPVIYNDYMNTLDGQPSTEALLPLIHAAADAVLVGDRGVG